MFKFWKTRPKVYFNIGCRDAFKEVNKCNEMFLQFLQKSLEKTDQRDQGYQIKLLSEVRMVLVTN